ncbi:MAG: CBS domain-containing protein [Anaerolineales bacterium]|nr:CBS domain-containing protein [Anaerolineales bacterium]
MKQNRTVLEAKRLEVFTCTLECPLREAAERMTRREISALVVVDAHGDLQGIITRMDLLRAHLTHDDWERRPVAAHMTREVVTVEPDTLLKDVAEQLVGHHIHRVVVIQPEDGRRRPVAVVSGSDLVYHMLKEV